MRACSPPRRHSYARTCTLSSSYVFTQRLEGPKINRANDASSFLWQQPTNENAEISIFKEAVSQTRTAAKAIIMTSRSIHVSPVLRPLSDSTPNWRITPELALELGAQAWKRHRKHVMLLRHLILGQPTPSGKYSVLFIAKRMRFMCCPSGLYDCA